MKLDKNQSKKIGAIVLTSTLLFTPAYAKAEENIQPKELVEQDIVKTFLCTVGGIFVVAELGGFIYEVRKDKKEDNYDSASMLVKASRKRNSYEDDKRPQILYKKRNFE